MLTSSCTQVTAVQLAEKSIMSRDVMWASPVHRILDVLLFSFRLALIDAIQIKQMKGLLLIKQCIL